MKQFIIWLIISFFLGLIVCYSTTNLLFKQEINTIKINERKYLDADIIVSDSTLLIIDVSKEDS